MEPHPSLKYVNLGRSGLKVSQFAYGNYVNSEEDGKAQQIANELVKAAFEKGINFFDTAEYYDYGKGERQMGIALKNLGVPRSDYVVSTKIFWGKFPDNTNDVNNVGTSRKRLIEGVDRSLKNLDLEYVDVLFCHRHDEDTPTIEVVRAMKDIINSGKALYWGTSTWPAVRVMEAILLADIVGAPRPIAEQCEYSMIVRDKIEKEYVVAFDDYGLGTTTWSPLCSGVLTGKYNDGIPADSRLGKNPKKSMWVFDLFLKGEKGEKLIPKLKKIGEVAKRLGCTQAQLALAWASLSKDVTTVLLGASRVSQIHQNLDALDVIPKLTPKVLEEIEGILDNRPDRGSSSKTYKPFPPRR